MNKIAFTISGLVWCVFSSYPIKAGNENKNNLNDGKVVQKQAVKNTSVSNLIIDHTPITSLPFGSPLLVSYKFPKNWKNYLKDDKSDLLTNTHKTFEKCRAYYRHLVDAKVIVKAPIIKSTKYFHIGEDADLLKYEKKFKAEFKYKLPDMGHYQVYFEYERVPMDYIYKLMDTANSFDKLYYEYANLVLYDVQIQRATILNIYHSYSFKEPTSGELRLFYIDTNKSIQIYEGAEGELDSAMEKAYSVEIEDNGKIIIKKSKK
ncbi:MAG: hypothetical protein JWR76_69 [Mucilaginibacter sp.]|nr:hypothetical protein [Mucilaginibacter sp.]